MASPIKIPLCCLVNKEGKCRKCRQPKCGDHSFQCSSCGTFCYDCSAEMACTKCGETSCGQCMKSGTLAERLCTYCYDEQFNYPYSNDYNEDEWDR